MISYVLLLLQMWGLQGVLGRSGKRSIGSYTWRHKSLILAFMSPLRLRETAILQWYSIVTIKRVVKKLIS
jgi:hypothetical protein